MDKIKFPGPAASRILKESGDWYATTTMGSRVCVMGRDGPIVKDYDGFKFIDFHCDASVNNLGGNHPAITEALLAQIETGNIFSEHHNAPNPHAIELARLLTAKSPVPQPAKVYFGNSGAEANETAIKICQAARRRKGELARHRTICFKDAFHGRTLGILPCTNSKPETQRDPFWNGCDRENTICLPYPKKGTSPRLFEDYFHDINPATIDRLIIELPCQGEGGVIPADEAAVRVIYDQTRKHNIFFIVDAIQCGMGRTGHLFGCDPLYYRWLAPDILTLGKALGGGIPVGATIFRAELDFAEKGMHSSTFGGGPLVMRTGLRVLGEIENLILANTVGLLQTRMHHSLTELGKKFQHIVTETRGVGAMWAHEIVSAESRDRIIQKSEELAESEEYGLRLMGAGRKAIRFMPPLNIPLETLTLGFALYEKVLSSV